MHLTAAALAELEKTIEDAFERRAEIDTNTKGAVREAVETALDLLDKGRARHPGCARRHSAAR